MVALSLTNSVVMPIVGGRWRAVLVCYAAVVFAAAVTWVGLSARAGAPLRDAGSATAGLGTQLDVLARLLRARPVQLLLLTAVGIFFFNHGLTNWLPEILRSRGMDAATAGYWASVPTAVGVVAALTVPHFASPARRVTTLAALLVAAAGATVLLHAAAGPLLAAGLLLQGVARGSMMAVAMLVLMDTREVGPADVGVAGGVFFSSAEIGGVLGPLAVGALYDWTGGFAGSLHLLTVLCVALTALVWRYERLTNPGASPQSLTHPGRSVGLPASAAAPRTGRAAPCAPTRGCTLGSRWKAPARRSAR
jgi:cyanate permease